MYKMALISFVYCLCIVISGKSETGGMRSGSPDWKKGMERLCNNNAYNAQHPVQEHQKLSRPADLPEKPKKTFLQKLNPFKK